MSCLSSALRLLGIRDLTEHQLRTKLESRGHQSSEINDVLERLKSEGTLSDQRLAGARARAEAERGRKGPHRVRRELEDAGITASLAKAAVKEAFEAVDPAETLAALIERRLQGVRRLDQAAYRRTYRFLLRRGFEATDVIAALKKYGGSRSTR
ncbi:MAG: regulatory protein RecX [Acidobacteria bacterium]|nr:regulatory protein RecX [Acidobacteriota bacterium]